MMLSLHVQQYFIPDKILIFIVSAAQDIGIDNGLLAFAAYESAQYAYPRFLISAAYYAPARAIH